MPSACPPPLAGFVAREPEKLPEQRDGAARRPLAGGGQKLLRENRRRDGILVQLELEMCWLGLVF